LGKRFPVFLTFAADETDPESVRVADLKVQFRAVGPSLQRVLGFRMLRGRFFNDGDTAGAAPVVVVNRAFVREYFGSNRDPGYAINQELLSYGEDKLAHIIGVIDDERQSSLLEQSEPEVEVCIPQITPSTGFYRVAEGLAMNLTIRTEQDPTRMIPELRTVFRSVSPELAASSFTTMDQVVDDSYGDRRTAAHLLQTFAGAALILCIVGLYGVLACVVAQRTRELGVRLALGAQKRQVTWLVMRRAVTMLLSGSAVGLLTCLAATRVISNLIYGVKPYDAITLSAATLLLVATGLLASYIPARRAANVDPMQALRTE